MTSVAKTIHRIWSSKVYPNNFSTTILLKFLGLYETNIFLARLYNVDVELITIEEAREYNEWLSKIITKNK